MFVLACSSRLSRPAEQIGLALLFVAALGNLLDRWGDGHVSDYFHTGW
ncbi:signal peptidase II [Kineosporia babensis]|nr:signal peptidase II [Kineosporia babensis]